MRAHTGFVACCTANLLCVLMSAPASAQIAGSTKASTVTIEGEVQDVFQSRGSRGVLVEILANRSEVGRLNRADAGIRFPAPGELVYVHMTGDGGRAQRGQRVRATLTRGQWGRWDGALDTSSGSGGGEPTTPSIGITSKRVAVGLTGRGLQVESVRAGSPAARAGIEIGDVLVAVNGKAIKEQRDLDRAFERATAAFKVTVRDVRTGREVDVDVPTQGGATPTARSEPQPLGITGELAFVGGSEAIKVASVQPGGPADRAGLREGLLIVSINGKMVTGLDDLTGADRNGRRSISIEVFDPRTKQKGTVRINR